MSCALQPCSEEHHRLVSFHNTYTPRGVVNSLGHITHMPSASHFPLQMYHIQCVKPYHQYWITGTGMVESRPPLSPCKCISCAVHKNSPPHLLPSHICLLLLKIEPSFTKDSKRNTHWQICTNLFLLLFSKDGFNSSCPFCITTHLFRPSQNSLPSCFPLDIA